MDWLVWKVQSGGRTRVLWRMSVIWTWSIGRTGYAGFCGSWRGIRGSEFWHLLSRPDIDVLISLFAVSTLSHSTSISLVSFRRWRRSLAQVIVCWHVLQICWRRKVTKHLPINMARMTVRHSTRRDAQRALHWSIQIPTENIIYPSTHIQT